MADDNTETEKIEAAPDVFINNTIEDIVNYLMEKKINYIEKNGQIYFAYLTTFGNAKREGAHRFELKGRVPKNIKKQGKEIIKSYVREQIKNYLTAEVSQQKKDENFQKNPDFPISTKYDGQKLEGKIILAKVRYFRVRLETPLQGEMNSLNYGFASAMAGHHIFSRDESNNLTLSEMTVNDAKDILIEIYEAEKNKIKYGDMIKLVDELNQEQGEQE